MKQDKNMNHAINEEALEQVSGGFDAAFRYEDLPSLDPATDIKVSTQREQSKSDSSTHPIPNNHHYNEHRIKIG